MNFGLRRTGRLRGARHRVGFSRAGCLCILLTGLSIPGGLLISHGSSHADPVVAGSIAASPPLEVEGPYGGDVRGILPLGSSGWILWTSDAGPFVRHGGSGPSWRPARDGFPIVGGRIVVSTLSVCQGRPDILVAALMDGGIYRSEDGGASWNPTGLIQARGEMVRVLAVHPGDPSRLLAATRSRLLVSSDGGRSWTELLQPWSIDGSVPEGGVDIQVMDILVDPLRPGTALVMTREQGTLLTANWGQDLHWFRGNLPGPLQAAALDPTIGSIGYAVAGGDLYRTVDAGETWEFLGWSGRGAVGRAGRIAVDPEKPSRLVVLGSVDSALKVSEDGGLTWADRALPSGEKGRSLGVHPLGLSRGLLLGTDRGVWRSYDAGQSWTPATKGLADVTVLDLEADPGGSGSIWAVTDCGLMTFDTVAWRPSGLPGGLGSSASGLCVTGPADPRLRLLGLDGLWDVTTAPGSPIRLALPLLADWGAADVVSMAGDLWLCGVGAESLWVGRADDDRLALRRGVMEAGEDKGSPWLYADPCDPGALFLGYGSLFKTTDGGAAWRPVDLPAGVGWVWDIARVVNSCGDLLVAADRGLYRREEATGDWIFLWPRDDGVQEVLCDPVQRRRWFVRSGGAVFATKDGGGTWVRLDVPSGQVTSLAWDAASERLLVGLQDEGVGWYDFRDQGHLGMRIEPIAVSPNPFQEEAVVRFRLHRPAEEVELNIYSVFGDLVRTVRQEGPFARDAEFQWTWDGTGEDGQRVAAGVYVFRSIIGRRLYGGKALHLR